MPNRRRETSQDSSGLSWAEAWTKGREDWLLHVAEDRTQKPSSAHRLRTLGTGNWGIDLKLGTRQVGAKAKHPRRAKSDLGISSLAKNVNHNMEGILSQLARFKGDFKPAPDANAKQVHRDMFREMHEALLDERAAVLDDASVSLAAARSLLDAADLKRKGAEVDKKKAMLHDDETSAEPKTQIVWTPQTSMTELQLRHRVAMCREDPQGHAIKVAKILDDRATINDQYKLYDVVKANRSPEALRVTLPQPRAKHLAEIRIRKAAHLKERRIALEAADLECRHQLQMAAQEKLDQAHRAIETRRQEYEHKRLLGRLLSWFPLAALSGRMHVAASHMRAMRGIRIVNLRLSYSARIIQRFAEHWILENWRKKRIRRGLMKLKILLRIYRKGLMQRVKKRSVRILLSFCAAVSSEHPTSRAIRSFAFKMRIIQRCWRRYAVWMHQIVDTRCDQLQSTEDAIIAEWRKKQQKALKLLKIDPTGETFGELKDFDVMDEPHPISPHIRSALALESFKLSQALHKAALAKDAVLFAEYMSELRKRVAMDKAREVFGKEKDSKTSAQALDAPHRPEFPSHLTEEAALALVHRGRLLMDKELLAAHTNANS